MGVLIKKMMRVALALIAIAAFATAVPSEFTEEAPMLDLAQMEGEVKSDINAMQKRGATEADCKDLAKTSCLEVRREVSTNQRVINKLKTGRHCIHLGQGTVRKTTLHWQKTKKTHHSMRIKVTHALRTRVHTSAQRFSSLKRGHCGFIFSSGSYLVAHRRYKHAVKMERSWRGRVSEAWKAVLRAREIARRMVHRCHCSTKRTEAKVWSTVSNVKLIRKQNKALAKCLMMTCVLNGTPVSNSKCRGKLPALRRKKLYRDTARARCNGRALKRAPAVQPKRRL